MCCVIFHYTKQSLRVASINMLWKFIIKIFSYRKKRVSEKEINHASDADSAESGVEYASE
jgi:hypothetical protein